MSAAPTVHGNESPSGSEAYEDLRAALQWGADLDLRRDQRRSLESLCCRIGGCVPSWRLKEAGEAKRKAEERANELEQALKARRDEFVFRRQRKANVSQNVSQD
jgi:hypothetical protein